VALYNKGAAGSITDTNGNTITNNGNGTFTDTLGVTALTIGGSATPSSPLTFTYPVTLQANSATSATASIAYKTYTVQTHFQCSGITEYGATSVNLVDHITLADGVSTYNFTYEPTPGISGAVTGRLASVTLPTGGTISYSYSGGCSSAGAGINPDGNGGESDACYERRHQELHPLTRQCQRHQHKCPGRKRKSSFIPVHDHRRPLLRDSPADLSGCDWWTEPAGSLHVLQRSLAELRWGIDYVAHLANDHSD
jgi:hypothetical protein